MKIAFWSEHENAGTTFNMAAVACATVMLYPISVAVLAGGYEDRDLESQFRFAQKGDGALVLRFIKGLAAYEKLSSEVVATAEDLEQELFEKKHAEVLFAVMDGKEVGFALFFHNFSTFLGRAGLYLEDLFVLPEYRGKGCGKGLLRELARIACERGCGRMEWVCLDWNRPSIDFYLRLKAEPLQDWTIYRLAGETLKDFAESEG